MQYVGQFDAKEINSTLIEKLNQKEFEPVPTLYIGLGGTGKDILLRMRENLFVKYEEEIKDEKLFPIKFLYYDLDQNSSQYDDRGIYNDDYFKKFTFKDDELLLIKPDTVKTLELIKKKQPNVSNISKWIGSGLQSMDTSIGAGQQRQISRLSFFVCFNEIENAIKSKLKELGEIKTNTKHGTDQTFRIVLVFSVAGGTGCGSFVDMAFLCKHLLKEVSTTANAKHEIISHVILPGAFKNVTTDSDKLNSNGYAALKEIEYYMFPNNNFNVEWEYGAKKSIEGPIFNRCYIISGDRYQNSPSFGSIQEVFNTVADYLSCEIDSSTKFAPLRNSAVSNCSDFLNNYIFSEVSDKEQGVFYTDLNFYSCKYSSYGLSRIGIPKERIQKACSAQLGLDVINSLKENPIKKHMPNEIEDLASKFANSFFISINNENSMPFRELTMYSTTENKTIFDTIDETVNNFIESDNFKKANNFDALKIYDLFIKDIITKFVVPSNSNEKSEFVKKIQNNFNMIVEEKIEDLKIGKKFYEIFYNNKYIDNHKMILPDISTNYGIEKTKIFFNKLKEEIEKYKAALDSESKRINSNLSLNELKLKLNEISENIKKSSAEALKKLNSLKDIKSKYDEYDEYFKKGDSFKIAEMAGLFKKGQTTLSKMQKSIESKIDSIEKNVNNILFENKLPLKELLVKTVKDEFKRSILIKLINEYYDNYLLEFFKPFEDFKNTKYGFLPIVAINNFEKKIQEIENLLKQRYNFYSNYKVPQSVKIIKDGREITGKDFKGIIKDYYQEVNDDFTGLAQTQFCDTDKNKFIEYLENWKRIYYTNKGNNEKNLNEFIEDVIGITDKDDFNKLFEAINKYADILTQKKLNEKTKFNIFTTNSSSGNAIINNHQDMMKLSSFCFKQASDVHDSGSNKICRENINFFRWVFSDEIVKTKTDFSDFYNSISSNLVVTKNKEDSINYFSELHGFPLYFCHIVGKDLKNSYNKLKKDFSRPLHIEKNNDKFYDLIPIFDYATVNDYRNKLKIGLMAMLFNVLKYEKEEDSFNFNYQRAQGDAYDKKELKLGQMALEEMDENIVHLKKTISVKEYLESRYIAGDELKYSDKILSERGKLKIYFALLYLNRIILKNNEDIKNTMENQITADKKDNNSQRVISGKVDSLLRDIIDKEIQATNHPNKELFNEFDKKYELKIASDKEWKETQAIYKAEIFDYIDEDKPAASIKFSAEAGDFKE